MKEEKANIKEEIYEILYLVKVCLTSFWFWLPVLFAIFMYSQLLILFIHPLLLLVTPTIISIYAILQEKKRLKARYKIGERKILSASDPLGTKPHAPTSKNVIEEIVEEYVHFLKEKKKRESVS
ncbi:MAG: hypothetical protein QW279_15870 [Candidatus Jordarchaeaceae archaeon]